MHRTANPKTPNWSHDRVARMTLKRLEAEESESWMNRIRSIVEASVDNLNRRTTQLVMVQAYVQYQVT